MTSALSDEDVMVYLRLRWSLRFWLKMLALLYLNGFAFFFISNCLLPEEMCPCD